jgi:hypothetical protein
VYQRSLAAILEYRHELTVQKSVTHDRILGAKGKFVALSDVPHFLRRTWDNAPLCTLFPTQCALSSHGLCRTRFFGYSRICAKHGANAAI